VSDFNNLTTQRRLAIPTVHMNGTNKDELIDQLCTAGSAIQNAMKAMEAACPNGRDYYPQGDSAIQEALRQHANRLHNLKAAYVDLQEIADAIDAQGRR
jgi:hypothetical protein